jgi:hypothetical protein
MDFSFTQVSLTLCIPWENRYSCCIVTDDDATYCMVISPVLEKFSKKLKVLEWNSFLPFGHNSFKVLGTTDNKVGPQFTQSWHSCTNSAIAQCTYRRIECSLLECISHSVAPSIYPHHLAACHTFATFVTAAVSNFLLLILL